MTEDQDLQFQSIDMQMQVRYEQYKRHHFERQSPDEDGNRNSTRSPASIVARCFQLKEKGVNPESEERWVTT